MHVTLDRRVRIIILELSALDKIPRRWEPPLSPLASALREHRQPWARMPAGRCEAVASAAQ